MLDDAVSQLLTLVLDPEHLVALNFLLSHSLLSADFARHWRPSLASGEGYAGSMHKAAEARE